MEAQRWVPLALELPPSVEEIERRSVELEAQPAEAVLAWAIETFGNRIALASSFGAEDVVIIDMLSRLVVEPRVFTLDTGRLPQETYDVMDAVRARYGLSLEVHYPDPWALRGLVRTHGFNLFYNSVEERKLCCQVRKVEPLNRALRGLGAWISGLRREQVITRASTRKVEVDHEHGDIVKVNPLTDWTWSQVWDYIKANDVPYNKLHDQGYPSIGCAPCTRAVGPLEDPRAGRWWWEQGAVKECGLHFDPRSLKLIGSSQPRA